MNYYTQFLVKLTGIDFICVYFVDGTVDRLGRYNFLRVASEGAQRRVTIVRVDARLVGEYWEVYELHRVYSGERSVLKDRTPDLLDVAHSFKGRFALRSVKSRFSGSKQKRLSVEVEEEIPRNAGESSGRVDSDGDSAVPGMRSHRVVSLRA